MSERFAICQDRLPVILRSAPKFCAAAGFLDQRWFAATSQRGDAANDPPEPPKNCRKWQKEAIMTQDKHQAIIDDLTDQIFELRTENDRLKAENRRLGGTACQGKAIQERACINCGRRLPDGPEYFPGYLEPMGDNSAEEARRYHCIYCHAEIS